MTRLALLMLLLATVPVAAQMNLQQEAQHYEEQVQRDPSNTSARWELTWIYQELGQRQQALGHLEEMLSRGISGEALWEQYFELLAETGDKDDRLAQARRAVKAVEPASFELEVLARHGLRNGEYEIAEKHLATLLERDGENKTFVRLLAQCHLQQKDYPEARKLAERMVELEPYDFDSYKELATIALMERRIDLATKAMDRFIESRQRPTVYRSVVGFFFDAGRYDEALSYIARASQLRVDSGQMARYALKIYLLQEKYDLYADTVLDFLGLHSNSVQFLESNIREMATCEDCLRALATTLNAPKHQSDAKAKLALSLVRYSLNDLEGSLDSFLAALRLTAMPASVVSDYVSKLRTDGEPGLGFRALDAYQRSLRQIQGRPQVWDTEWERVRLLVDSQEHFSALSIVDRLLAEEDGPLPERYGIPFAELALRSLRAKLCLYLPNTLSQVQGEAERVKSMLSSAEVELALREGRESFRIAEDIWEGYMEILAQMGAVDRAYEETFLTMLGRANSWSLYTQNLRDLDTLYSTGPLAEDYQQLKRMASRFALRRGESRGDKTLAILNRIIDRFDATLRRELELTVVDARLVGKNYRAAQRLLAYLEKDDSLGMKVSFRSALLSILEESPEDAVEALREQIVRHPEAPEATSMLFLLDLTKRFGLDMPRELARFARGWLLWEHYQLREADSAFAELEQMPDDSPMLADVMLSRALLAFQRGDQAAASKHLARLVESFPTSPQLGHARYLEAALEEAAPQDAMDAFTDGLEDTSWYLWAKALEDGRVRRKYLVDTMP